MSIKRKYIYGKYHQVHVEADSIEEFFENLAQVPEFWMVSNSLQLRERLVRLFTDTLENVQPEESELIFNKLLEYGVIKVMDNDS